MSETDQVIDIERNENVVIDVNVVEDASVTQVTPQESIFVTWKRLIIGTSVLLLLIVPIVGGAWASYCLRRYLHEPADPFNVWPDTEYRGPSQPVQMQAVDKGYSTNPNNYVLIKNGGKDYFEVKSTKGSSSYIAVYMIENLFGDINQQGLHVVSSSYPTNLAPLKNISFAKDYLDIEDRSMFRYYDNYRIGINTESGDRDLSCSLADVITGTMNFNSQKDGTDAIAQKINQALNSSSSEKYYRPSQSKYGSYMIPSYSYGYIESFQNLCNIRNGLRAKHKKTHPTQNEEVILEKPTYRRIALEHLNK